MEISVASQETIAKFEEGTGVFFRLDVEPLIGEIDRLIASMEAYSGDWLKCQCGHWHPQGYVCVFCGKDSSDVGQ